MARCLAGNGVRIPPQPNGAAARAGLVLTPHLAEATRYVDGRGRLATRIGPEGPVPVDPEVPPEEGPWRCIACRSRYSGGWSLAGPDRRPFACGRCVTVVG